MYTNTTTSRSTNHNHSNHCNNSHLFYHTNATSSISNSHKNKDESLLLLQYCRSGQYELIKQYLLLTVNQYPKKKMNGMVHENCLQYVIRSTCFYNSTTNRCCSSNDNDNVVPNQIVQNNNRHDDPMLLLDVIQLLLEYNPNQLYVRHPLTGTILHEAIQYKCSNRIIYYILQYNMNRYSSSIDNSTSRKEHHHCHRQEQNDNDNLMDYDYYYNDNDDSNPLHATTCSTTTATTTEISSSSTSSSFIVTNSCSTPPIINLLSVQDDIGRTVLHCMVSRWQRSYHNQYYYYGNHNNNGTGQGTSCNNNNNNQNDITTLELFHMIMKVYSQQVLIHDVDGYTPLLQLLQTPTIPISISLSSSSMTVMEQEIYTIVQYMIQYQPNVVMIAKQIPYYNSSSLSLKAKSPNQYYHSSKFHATTAMTMITNDHDDNTNTASKSLNVQQYNNNKNDNQNEQNHIHSTATASNTNKGIHTPLFYALLYGRSLQTIQLLIDTYRQIQQIPNRTTTNNNESSITPRSVPYCALQLSQYKEIALHIVITTMLSTNILQCIVQDYMIGTFSRDMYTLTSIDWVWFVYVREYSNKVLQQQQEQHGPIINHNNHIPDHHQHQQQQQQHTATRLRQLIARRRHLPDHTLVWHNYLSERILHKLQQYNNNNTGETIHHYINPNDNDDNDNIDTTGDRENTESILLLNREQLSLLSNELEYIENDFIHRISILLPAAAKCKFENECKYGYNNINFTSAPTTPISLQNPFHTDNGSDSKCNMYVLLNAACYVPCPVVVIQLLLLRLYDQQQNYQHQVQIYHPLQYRDPHTLRYPLHYAASRVSYHATLPIGYLTSSFTTIPTTTNNTTTSNGLHNYHDSSTPIHVIGPLFPNACCYCDIFGQLPLHIAIDTYKNHRVNLQQVQRHNDGNHQNNHNSNTFDQQMQLYNHEEDRVLQLLVQLYPSSIHIRDGKTKLYPFQQAAVVEDGVVSVPTFTCHTAITVMNDDNSIYGSNAPYENNNGCRLTTIYQLLRLNPSLIT